LSAGFEVMGAGINDAGRHGLGEAQAVLALERDFSTFACKIRRLHALAGAAAAWPLAA
jgi:hypothetical protein